jgi:hypothetical protein
MVVGAVMKGDEGDERVMKGNGRVMKGTEKVVK